MIPLDSMKTKLLPLGLYSLSGETLVDAELQAYQAGWEPLCSAMEETIREMFLATAQSWGISRRELLFGPEKTDLPLEDRREMLLARLCVTENDVTREAIERAVIASGFDVSIVERPEKGEILVSCIRILSDLTEQEAMKRAASEFLPAHLVWDFDFSLLLWNRVDELDLTFNEMDGADLSWDEIDVYHD